MCAYALNLAVDTLRLGISTVSKASLELPQITLQVRPSRFGISHKVFDLSGASHVIAVNIHHVI